MIPAQDAAEIRAFHRPLWEQARQMFLQTEINRSLQSLAEQGYALEDIGLMFGVTRERVRQWMVRAGVTQRTVSRGTSRGTGHRRVWDDLHNQFVPAQSLEKTRRERAYRRQQRQAQRRQALERRRQTMVECLKSLAADLRRTPTLAEFTLRYGGRGGTQAGQYISSWWGMAYPIARGRARHADISAELYRLAGLKTRATGASGHVSFGTGVAESVTAAVQD